MMQPEEFELVPRQESTLMELLRRNHKAHHIEYGPSYSNHLAHALVALNELGASSDRLREFYNSYQTQSRHGMGLQPARPREIDINKSNWKQYLGSRRYYADYYEFFLEEIKSHSLGLQRTLDTFLPELLPGISSALFHPLIHIGLGLRLRSDPIMVAEGLAYLCYAYHPLSSIKTEASDESISNPMDILSALVNDKELQPEEIYGSDPRSFGFFQRMSMLGYDGQSHWSRLMSHASKWTDLVASKSDDSAPTDEAIDKALSGLIEAALSIYHSTGAQDFFLLHGVTGVFAVYSLTRVLSDNRAKLELMRQFWIALVCTYIADGCPSVNTSSLSNLKSGNWEQLIDCAIASNDAHLIKVVFCCRQLAREFFHADVGEIRIHSNAEDRAPHSTEFNLSESKSDNSQKAESSTKRDNKNSKNKDSKDNKDNKDKDSKHKKHKKHNKDNKETKHKKRGSLDADKSLNDDDNKSKDDNDNNNDNDNKNDDDADEHKSGGLLSAITDTISHAVAEVVHVAQNTFGFTDPESSSSSSSSDESQSESKSDSQEDDQKPKDNDKDQQADKDQSSKKKQDDKSASSSKSSSKSSLLSCAEQMLSKTLGIDAPSLCYATAALTCNNIRSQDDYSFGLGWEQRAGETSLESSSH